MGIENPQTPLSGFGKCTMAPRRSGNGWIRELGVSKHPEVAQGKGDPSSTNSQYYSADSVLERPS